MNFRAQVIDHLSLAGMVFPERSSVTITQNWMEIFTVTVISEV